MAYKITNWELSDIPAEQIQQQNSGFTEGIHTVKILEARYEDEFTAEKPELAETYTITIESVNGESRTTLRYWLKNKERTLYNATTVGTLRSLGKAIFGAEFSQAVPAPVDIIGAVVDAEIKVIRAADGKTYQRCYHYQPTAAENVLYSDIEQYYKG